MRKAAAKRARDLGKPHRLLFKEPPSSFHADRDHILVWRCPPGPLNKRRKVLVPRPPARAMSLQTQVGFKIRIDKLANALRICRSDSRYVRSGLGAPCSPITRKTTAPFHIGNRVHEQRGRSLTYTCTASPMARPRCSRIRILDAKQWREREPLVFFGEEMRTAGRCKCMWTTQSLVAAPCPAPRKKKNALRSASTCHWTAPAWIVKITSTGPLRCKTMRKSGDGIEAPFEYLALQMGRGISRRPTKTLAGGCNVHLELPQHPVRLSLLNTRFDPIAQTFHGTSKI